MMEVNIIKTEQTATHSTYTIFCSESGTYCGSTVHTIYQVDSEKTVDASLLNAKMQFCCNGLILSEKKNFHFFTRNRNYIQPIEPDCRSRGCELAPDLVP